MDLSDLTLWEYSELQWKHDAIFSVFRKGSRRSLLRSHHEEIRVKGSHQRLRHLDGRTTMFPYHSHKTFRSGALACIPLDVRISRT
jgi:predicted RNA binding protein YcfA (HicA-like mRNA interferase family)